MSTVENIHHFHRSTGKSRYDTCNKFCRYKYRYSTIETKEPDRIGYNWFLSRLDIFNSKVGKFSIRCKKILNSR
jgi:hypothetical protein